MPTKQNDNDLEPLLDTQQDHLAMLVTESSSIDAKALGLGAANVAVLIFIAQSNLAFSSWVAHSALLVPYALSLICSAVAILPQKYVGAGVNIDASPEYLDMQRDALVLQLLSNVQVAIKTNDRLNKMRWRFCAISLVFSTIGTGILFVIL